MRTRLMIMAIVLAAATGAIAVITLLVLTLGWLGLAIGGLGTTTLLVVYRLWVQPWQHRWGATGAIPIAAPPEQVWPWLVQLGYGRAGWYMPAGEPMAADWQMTLANAFWILLSDPGPFIMERRMLKGIKARAERAVPARKHAHRVVQGR